MKDSLVRIGIYYDGNFLFHVSNYYYYQHQVRSRISIGGLHGFIRKQVADSLGVDEAICQVVDVHYFRGRIPASDTNKDAVYKERMFEDVLVREGVTTHYLPVSSSNEKGVDVLFALEALEAATVKKLDLVVLVASDGDYVPLVRKISAAGSKTMLIGCDFSFVDESGNKRVTRTSTRLYDEVSYPVLLNEALEDATENSDPDYDLWASLFVPKKNRRHQKVEIKDGEFFGKVQNVLNGYGFITPEDGESFDKNLFFHMTDVEAGSEDLETGDRVKFEMGTNDKGVCAKKVAVVDDEIDEELQVEEEAE